MTENNSIKLAHDNGSVVLVINNDPKGLKMPWQRADELVEKLHQMARIAEEYCKANQIIADNALMQRAGIPIGLSGNPLIKKESIQQALYDRDLRRAIPHHKATGLGNIRARGVVGAPKLRRNYA